MSAIELLLRLAKIREDQAMARAKRAAGQVNQTKASKNQVLEYAKDYEIQMLKENLKKANKLIRELETKLQTTEKDYHNQQMKRQAWKKDYKNLAKY